MSALSWIGDLFNAILKFVPRLVFVPATHGAVLFKRNGKYTVWRPGLHWYWPVWSEYITVPVVRQTLDLPSQTLMTEDLHTITIAVVLVYSIRNIGWALTRQWDIDDTVNDIGRTAVREHVATRTFDTLRSGGAKEDKMLAKLLQSRLKQYGVNVQRASITDLAETDAYTLIMPDGGLSGG